MAACLNNGGGESSGGNGAGGGAGSGNGPGRTVSNDTLLWTPRTGEITTRQPGSTWGEPSAAPAPSSVLPWRGGIDAGGSSFSGHGLVVPPVGRGDGGGGGGVGTVGYGSGGMGAMLTSKPHMTSNGRSFEVALPSEGQFGPGPGYHPMRSAHQQMERSPSLQATPSLEHHRQLPEVHHRGSLGFSSDPSQRTVVLTRRSHQLSPSAMRYMHYQESGMSHPGMLHPAIPNASMPYPDMRRQHVHLERPHPDMPRTALRRPDLSHADAQRMSIIMAEPQGMATRLSVSMAAPPSGSGVLLRGTSPSLTSRMQRENSPYRSFPPPSRTSVSPPPLPRASRHPASVEALSLSPERSPNDVTVGTGGVGSVRVVSPVRAPRNTDDRQDTTIQAQRRQTKSTKGLLRIPSVPALASASQAELTMTTTPVTQGSTLSPAHMPAAVPEIAHTPTLVSGSKKTPASSPKPASASNRAIALKQAPTSLPASPSKPLSSPKQASATKATSVPNRTSALEEALPSQSVSFSKTAPSKTASATSPASSTKTVTTPKRAAPSKSASSPRPSKTLIPSKRSNESKAVLSNKRSKTEGIRPLSAPMEEPPLQIPEVSDADVGKVVLSETKAGTLTGVVEAFVERGDIGVWKIRYENGELEEIDDCGELHDDMCAYFEFAGHASTATGDRVRSRNNLWLQEQVRVRLLKDDTCILGRHVCAVRGKELREGEVVEYVQPTRDGEIEQWRVAYADGEHEDLESFELVVPLLRYVEKRIERREIPWGNRTLPAYVHRSGDKIRAFSTLAGISESMPAAPRDEADV